MGSFRTYLEQDQNCHAIYFQGACGNVNAFSYFSADMHTKNYTVHGQMLGAYAVVALENNMTPIENGKIQVRRKNFSGEVNHATDLLVDKAKLVQQVWTQTNDKAQANAVGLPYGIRSPYQASAIITRAGLGSYLTVELNAITIGDALAIVTAPDELFDANSAWLEENSPYATTLTFGYANGARGYIPSQEAYDYTCYESDVTKFVPGTGELIQESFLIMLQGLAAASR